MNLSALRLEQAEVDRIAHEVDIVDRTLALAGSDVLELGCGTAEKTRFLATKAKTVTALEVDARQLTRNSRISGFPNIAFGYGAAESIPSSSSEFDFAFMFKSLHHVPVDMMDQAFLEIHRVLKPGGMAYISEPVYAGDFNDIVRLFNDEKRVRHAAFLAIQRAIESRRFSLVGQLFFSQPIHFDDFAQFAERMINVTHSNLNLSIPQLKVVQKRFEKHLGSGGADFNMPIRVDLLRRVDD